MSIKKLIQKKRDGGVLNAEDLDHLMKAVLDGSAKDYQISAWLMTVYFRGMGDEEMVALVEAMWRSGKTLPREKVAGQFFIDKHSTGGVGDKTSLILVPLVTSVCERLLGKDCLKIPMISGRSLGHTGGTLDKLESVPGFRTGLSVDEAMSLLSSQGYFMMGQTSDIAPVDKVLYSLRDSTSTVDSLPLIVSSILSKKLAENLDGLVFDVKYGAGAIFPDVENARRLGITLTQVARKLGVKASGLLTRMDEPLGRAVGNFCEVEECAQFLTGELKDSGLEEVTMRLAQTMVELATDGKVRGAEAIRELELDIQTRRAFECFVQMLESQGGSWRAFSELKEKWQRERKTYLYRAPVAGFVSHVAAKHCAEIVGLLGGLRPHKEAAVDHMVGLLAHAKVGDEVKAGDVLLEVHARDDKHFASVERLAKETVTIASSKVTKQPWVLEVLS